MAVDGSCTALSSQSMYILNFPCPFSDHPKQRSSFLFPLKSPNGQVYLLIVDQLDHGTSIIALWVQPLRNLDSRSLPSRVIVVNLSRPSGAKSQLQMLGMWLTWSPNHVPILTMFWVESDPATVSLIYHVPKLSFV